MTEFMKTLHQNTHIDFEFTFQKVLKSLQAMDSIERGEHEKEVKRVKEEKRLTFLFIFILSTLETEEFFNTVFVQTYLLIEKYIRVSDNQSLTTFTNGSLLNECLSSKLSIRTLHDWPGLKRCLFSYHSPVLSPRSSPQTSALSFTLLFSLNHCNTYFPCLVTPWLNLSLLHSYPVTS